MFKKRWFSLDVLLSIENTWILRVKRRMQHGKLDIESRLLTYVSIDCTVNSIITIIITNLSSIYISKLFLLKWQWKKRFVKYIVLGKLCINIALDTLYDIDLILFQVQFYPENNFQSVATFSNVYKQCLDSFSRVNSVAFVYANSKFVKI